MCQSPSTSPLDHYVRSYQTVFHNGGGTTYFTKHSEVHQSVEGKDEGDKGIRIQGKKDREVGYRKEPQHMEGLQPALSAADYQQ